MGGMFRGLCLPIRQDSRLAARVLVDFLSRCTNHLKITQGFFFGNVSTVCDRENRMSDGWTTTGQATVWNDNGRTAFGRPRIWKGSVFFLCHLDLNLFVFFWLCRNFKSWLHAQTAWLQHPCPGHTHNGCRGIPWKNAGFLHISWSQWITYVRTMLEIKPILPQEVENPMGFV